MSTLKRLVKPMNYFVPISRIDEEKRLVGGIAFANEVVSGEGGLRILASAMEAATPEYMQYGTLRAMHQASAAGTAVPNDVELAKECGVTWSDMDFGGETKRVAEMVTYVSDDADWKKVKDGTYKGLSIGVQPTKQRGKTIEALRWIETSLVDRPKDPDAILHAFRVLDTAEGAECEVIDEEPVERTWTPAEIAEYSRFVRLNLGTGNVERYRELSYPCLFSDDQVTRLAGDVEDEECMAIFIAGVDEFNRVEEIERRKWTKAMRDKLAESDFGDPEARLFPIADQDDVDSAAKLIGKAKNPKAVKARIIKIAKRKKLTIPDSWQENRAEIADVYRGKFADLASDAFPNRLRYMAIDLLDTVLYSIANYDVGTPAEKETAAREAIGEFADFVIPMVTANSWPDPTIFDDLDDDDRAASPTLARFAELQDARQMLHKDANAITELMERSKSDKQTISALTIERDESSAELTRVQESLQDAETRMATAEGRVVELENTPARRLPPVRSYTALERTYGGNAEASAQEKEWKDELERLTSLPPTSNQNEGDVRIGRIMQLKAKLAGN